MRGDRARAAGSVNRAADWLCHRQGTRSLIRSDRRSGSAAGVGAAPRAHRNASATTRAFIPRSSGSSKRRSSASSHIASSSAARLSNSKSSAGSLRTADTSRNRKRGAGSYPPAPLPIAPRRGLPEGSVIHRCGIQNTQSGFAPDRQTETSSSTHWSK
jgi:hypothetical protein